MSYDLFFNGAHATPTRADFAGYFANRDRYTLKGLQAFYENGDTGVYFCFEFCEDGDEASEPIAFNLNYFRPHFFGLEAGLEVDAFVRRFNLDVSDPQTHGMGNGPFSVEGFLRGWNAGNRSAFFALLSVDNRPDVFVYPTDSLESVRRWNFGRATLQREVGDSLFVPKYMFMKSGNRACTAIVWPDACPIYVPQSDLVFVLRDTTLRAAAGDHSPEIAIVNWQQIAPIITLFPQHDGVVPYYQLVYDVPPNHIVDFIKSLPIAEADKELGLANDQVLNEELVSEALGGRSPT